MLAAALAALAAVPLLVGLWQDHASSRISPRPAEGEEQVAILTAVFRDLPFEGLPPPPPEAGEPAIARPGKVVILTDMSVVLCAPDAAADGSGCFADVVRSAEHDGLQERTFPTRLRRELAAANQTSIPMACPRLGEVRCVSHLEVDRIFVGDGWWNDFYDAFPGSSGWARVSRPVMTSDGRRALLYLEFTCDGLCGSGSLIALEKRGDTWAVADRLMLWVS